MSEPDNQLRLVNSLWYSNFRNLRIVEGGTVTVTKDKFSINAVSLLVDLARSYELDLEFRSSGPATSAVFAPKGML